MCKRKEPETCSESSEVYNPDNAPEFHEIPYLYKKRCTALNVNNPSFMEGIITSQHPDLCASFQVDVDHVQLNGEPFRDFFAQETKEKDVSDASPNLSNSCSKHYPVKSQSNISDFNNCHKENHSDSGTCVNSDQTPSVFSTDPCSKFPMLFGVPLVTVPIDAVPIDAVPLRIYHPDMGIRVYPPQQVEWTMKKVLTTSDCSDLHRLIIGKKLVEEQYISQLSESDRVEISSRNGLRVDVLDCDRGTELKLTLKRWPSNDCYGLMDNWKRDFVNRRGLKPGDEVGICWDKRHNRLLFSVLKRSSVVGC